MDIQKGDINGKGELVITAGLNNSGILGRTDLSANIFNPNTITVDMFGNAFYRNFKYKMVTHARVFSLEPKDDIILSEKIGLFMASAFGFINKKFGFENMCSWEKIKELSIKLPAKEDGSIDFDFMESFIAELEAERLAEMEAYLKVTGLDDYELTEAEEKALEDFKNDKISMREYTFEELFNNIKQGRRLKKDDQLPGDIPFVMSGVTNTGVVGYVSNPVASFPKNSITVDIFGNSFYRDYDFGAGDDTGVYWNEQIHYSKPTMLYFTAAMGKALFGKFSYGHKLRSSQSKDFKISLPIKDGEPDYSWMDTFVSAIQKQVIKNVVFYADQKIQATETVIRNRPAKEYPTVSFPDTLAADSEV